MTQGKVPCLYCGVPIMAITAELNNGYCTPHSWYGLTFAKKMYGKVEILEQQTVQSMEKTIKDEMKDLFWLLVSTMKTGDTLAIFKEIPIPSQLNYIEKGIAIIRDNEMVNGFAIAKKRNPAYFEDHETIITKEEYIKYFVGESELEAFEKFVEPGDVFCHFISSQRDWDLRCGRELAHIKRNNEIIHERILRLN